MPNFDLQVQKKALVQNLDYFKSLPVEEYTFIKKCDELHNHMVTDRASVHEARSKMWCPENFEDEKATIAEIESLRPKIVICDNKQLLFLWELYRRFAHSGECLPTPGRFIKFLVANTHPNGLEQGNALILFTLMNNVCPPIPWPIIGFGAVSGDFPAIRCRDDYIGWTKDQKERGALKNTAVGSTIAATQPFGYNFLGAKLIAALITSAAIRNEWQLQYGDVLAGMTTTSLYGRPSIYDRLPWWRDLGDTTGRVPIQPKPSVYKRWLHYVQEIDPAGYKTMLTPKAGVSGPVTNYKIKILTRIFQEAGISQSQYQHGFERGVYFSEFYENTREFLCGRIGEDDLRLKQVFESDVEGVMEWWRPKAIRRYQKLKAENRLKPGKLFYNHIDQMDYATAKEIFLGDVGR